MSKNDLAGGYSTSYPADLRSGPGYRVEKRGLSAKIVADFSGVPLLTEAPAAGHILLQDPASKSLSRLDLEQLPTTVPQNGSVSNVKFAAAPPLTLKGNATSASAQPQDVPLSALVQSGNPVGDAIGNRLAKDANLADIADKAAARLALGAGAPNGLATLDNLGRLAGDAGGLAVTETGQTTSQPVADAFAAKAPRNSPVFTGQPRHTSAAVGDYLVTGPGNVVASQSPWDPSGAGVGNLRGAQEMKYATLYEDRNEFGLCVHMRATKGHAAMLAAQPGNDKVALAPTITAYQDGNNGSCWAFNPIVNAYAGAATDASYFGAEYDINNLCGKHYGDIAPLEGAGNFIGIIMTGLGVYRKTAGFMVTDVVPQAWNYGFVVPTNCIAANGSTFADFCSGHRASLDIRGQPDFAIRQVSDASRNWLNGRTLIGNYPDAAPQSRLHVEGGAVGGGVGQFVEVFRRNATVDSDSLQMRDTVYRIIPNTNQTGANSVLFRSGLYKNSDAPAVYTDTYTNGIWSLNHGSAGSSIVAYPDLRVRFGGNVDFANAPTADPHVAGRMYRSGGALMISLG